MQVLTAADNTDSDVLVGQAQKAQGFTVANDSIIMGLLSTALYANPLKSMLQEIVFNAWDAHKVAGITDRPIRVELDPASGLTITDYGHGIPREDMFDIYCVYAGTTKDQDENQTGGFGLGCKSPFAYNESFTVTSCNQGVKSLYMIVRSSEDAGGMPACTPVLSAATEETGLSVNVALTAEHHVQQALDYLHSILFLSGISAEIVVSGRTQYVNAESLGAGEYFIDTSASTTVDPTGVYAVYGGVKYAIRAESEYENELSYLSQVRQGCSLYIGFAPNTLTPLPSREALNNSGRTRENIRVALELCVERFRNKVLPLFRYYANAVAEECAKQNTPPAYGFYHMISVLGSGHSRVSTSLSAKELLPPKGSSDQVGDVLSNLFNTRPWMFMKLLTQDTITSILCHAFAKHYPGYVRTFRTIATENNPALYNYGYYKEQYLLKRFDNRYLVSLHKLERQLTAKFPDAKRAVFDRRIRSTSGSWVKTSRDPATTTNPQVYYRKFTAGTPRPDCSDRLFTTRDSCEVDQLFDDNTVVLARTISGLKEVDTHNFTYLDFLEHNLPIRVNMLPCVAYVIHETHGHYAAAKEMFESAGYQVIEAPYTPPVKGQRTAPSNDQSSGVTPTKPAVPTYNLLDTRCALYESVEECIDPTHFYYATYKDIREGSGTPRGILRELVEMHPKTVIVHNKTKAAKMEKAGIVPIQQALVDFMRELPEDACMFHTINYLRGILKEFSYSYSVVTDPIAQPLFGLPCIADPHFEAKYQLTCKLEENYVYSLNEDISTFNSLCRDHTLSVCRPLLNELQVMNFLDQYQFNSNWYDADAAGKRKLVDAVLSYLNTI